MVPSEPLFGNSSTLSVIIISVGVLDKFGFPLKTVQWASNLPSAAVNSFQRSIREGRCCLTPPVSKESLPAGNTKSPLNLGTSWLCLEIAGRLSMWAINWTMEQIACLDQVRQEARSQFCIWCLVLPPAWLCSWCEESRAYILGIVSFLGWGQFHQSCAERGIPREWQWVKSRRKWGYRKSTFSTQLEILPRASQEPHQTIWQWAN